MLGFLYLEIEILGISIQNGLKSRGFSRLNLCLLESVSVVPYANVEYSVNIIHLRSLISNKNIGHHLLIFFPIQRVRVVR